MGRMKKLIVLSPDPADYRVLHDLLRVYFPRLSFVEEEKGAVYWLTGGPRRQCLSRPLRG